MPDVEIYRVEGHEQRCDFHEDVIPEGTKYAVKLVNLGLSANGEPVRICADCLAAVFTATMFNVDRITVRDQTQ